MEEGENGERRDPQDAPEDVPAVRLQRRETDEDTRHALGDRGHDQEGEQEDDPEGEPLRESRPPEPADELQPARHAAALHGEHRQEQDEGREQSGEQPEEIPPGAGA